MSEDAAERLRARTEGWVAGLRLAAMSLAGRSDADRLVTEAHLPDVLLVLMGDVASVRAGTARAPRPAFPDADVDDVTAAILRFRSGAVASLASSCLGKLRAGVELFGDGVREAAFTVERAGRAETWRQGDEAKGRVDRDYIDAVQGRANRIRAPYASALRTHRLGVALTRSAASLRPLDVP